MLLLLHINKQGGIKMSILIIILVVVALIAFFVISVYNGLVQARIKVDNAWSQIDVQLQRRFDLIPNFVETVKGYMTHEKETLEKIAELRTSWANCNGVAEKADIDNQLSGALKTIMAVSENYPELKANQNFSELSEELRNTENKISFSRQFYNDTVTRYNTKIQVFPSNIIAGMFNFTARDLFKAESDEARKNVKVDFGNN
jgi:LemA protein